MVASTGASCWARRRPHLQVAGTAVGVLAGDLIGDPDQLGLDAIFPAFFLALLLSGEVSAGRRAVVAALLGGAVALALVPFAPAGIPVIAACIGALIGLDEAGRRGAAGEPEELEELEELGELEA